MRAARAMAVCLLLAAAALCACRRSGPDWRVQSLLGGTDCTEAITEPTEIWAYHVDPTPTKEAADGPAEDATGPFHRTTLPIRVGASAMARLSKVFSDPDTYDWQRVKHTVWTPKVGLTFVRYGLRVDLLLCLESDQVLVFLDDRFVNSEDTDAARPALLAALREALPGDAYLERLQ